MKSDFNASVLCILTSVLSGGLHEIQLGVGRKCYRSYLHEFAFRFTENVSVTRSLTLRKLDSGFGCCGPISDLRSRNGVMVNLFNLRYDNTFEV